MTIDRRSWGILGGRRSRRRARHPAIGRFAPFAGTPARPPARTDGQSQNVGGKLRVTETAKLMGKNSDHVSTMSLD
jgi:hypothetical protein